MVRKPSPQGLKKKFVAALLIAGFLPGVVALFATYLYSKNILKESIGTHFQEISSAVARKIEIIVNHDIEDAETLALSPDIRKLVRRANLSLTAEEGDRFRGGLKNVVVGYFRVLQEERYSDIQYGNIIVTDRTGRMVASLEEPEKESFGDRDWFQSSIQNGKGANYVSSLYFDEGKSNYYYDVAVPIRDPSGHGVQGVLKMGIPRDRLLEAIIEVRIGLTGHAMLVTSKGNPLICPILPPQDHLINPALMAQITGPNPSWKIAEDDGHGGQRSIVGFAPIHFSSPLTPSSLGQNEWYAFVRQHPSESYAPVYSLLAKAGMVGFGLVLVISFLGFFVGQRIVKPILLLKERAREIGQSSIELATQDGNVPKTSCLKERIDIQSGDEIQELAQAFNQMSAALEESLQTVKKQQKELVLKNELASIGQLLAGLTHDLKNPLGVIRSSAQILMEKKDSPKVRREMGRYIIEEVDRLTYRINDFLRFARPRPPEPRPVQLEKLIERTLWQWSAQGDGLEKIGLEKEISGTLSLVYVDPDHVLEALFNLLNNAREVMPDGGTITLRARENDDRLVEISVQDTGEGIDTEDLEKIFDPFFTTKEFGVGLGLTNVKRLIEDNSGQITVRSQKGQGTVFTILFHPYPSELKEDHEPSEVAYY